jgi:cytochrome c oxidase assembly protein subunit 11
MASVNRPGKDFQPGNKKIVVRLLWLVVAAALFGFALVPLYNVLCDVTGLNGKTNNEADLNKTVVDKNRLVTVEFTSTVMPGLGWDFYPQQPRITVHPGQVETVNFLAKNMTNVAVTGQAVPSVSPGQASPHFKKIECFCFQHQELKPGESKVMPLRFYVSPSLPANIGTVTLSYAFYSIKK